MPFYYRITGSLFNERYNKGLKTETMTLLSYLAGSKSVSARPTWTALEAPASSIGKNHIIYTVVNIINTYQE